MSCNKYKNKNYKSAVQTFNTATQPITATDVITNYVTLALGNKVTDTGMALEVGNNGVYVECSGLYRVDAIVNVDGTTGGQIFFALAMNGEVLPETIEEVTMVADVTKVVPLKTERVINICNTFGEYNFSVLAWSDGTAVGDVIRVSMTVVKDA